MYKKKRVPIYIFIIYYLIRVYILIIVLKKIRTWYADKILSLYSL